MPKFLTPVVYQDGTQQATAAAPLASPTFTGTPVAPTAAMDTNTTQIATTAYVLGQAASANPVMNGTADPGTSNRYARADHVHASDTSRVPNTRTVNGKALSADVTLVYTDVGFYVGDTAPADTSKIWFKKV